MTDKPPAPVTGATPPATPAVTAKPTTPGGKAEEGSGKAGAPGGAKGHVVATGAAIGIGSAAIVAALLYMRRK